MLASALGLPITPDELLAIFIAIFVKKGKLGLACMDDESSTTHGRRHGRIGISELLTGPIRFRRIQLQHLPLELGPRIV
jgi:hypothetical protein